jgi:hypothetical protein
LSISLCVYKKPIQNRIKGPTGTGKSSPSKRTTSRTKDIKKEVFLKIKTRKSKLEIRQERIGEGIKEEEVERAGGEGR